MRLVGPIVTLGKLRPAQALPQGRRGETPTQSWALAYLKAYKDSGLKGQHKSHV